MQLVSRFVHLFRANMLLNTDFGEVPSCVGGSLFPSFSSFHRSGVGNSAAHCGGLVKQKGRGGFKQLLFSVPLDIWKT